MGEVRRALRESNLFTESENQEIAKELDEVENKVDREVKSPKDVKNFIDKHDAKVCEKIKGNSKLSKAWDLLKKIAKAGVKGLNWILDHWVFVLTIIVAVSLYLFGIGGILKFLGWGAVKGLDAAVETLADGFAAITGPEYMAAGQKISDGCLAAGGYGGWSMAGLGGGLR